MATMPCTRPAWARWTCEEPAARSQILAVPSMDPGPAPEQVSAGREAGVFPVTTKLLVVPTIRAWYETRNISFLGLTGLTTIWARSNCNSLLRESPYPDGGAQQRRACDGKPPAFCEHDAEYFPAVALQHVLAAAAQDVPDHRQVVAGDRDRGVAGCGDGAVAHPAAVALQRVPASLTPVTQ